MLPNVRSPVNPQIYPQYLASINGPNAESLLSQQPLPNRTNPLGNYSTLHKTSSTASRAETQHTSGDDMGKRQLLYFPISAHSSSGLSCRPSEAEQQRYSNLCLRICIIPSAPFRAHILSILFTLPRSARRHAIYDDDGARRVFTSSLHRSFSDPGIFNFSESLQYVYREWQLME